MPRIGLDETRPQSWVPSRRRKRRSWLCPGRGAAPAQSPLRAGAGVRLDKVEDRPAQQAAVAVAQQIGQALIDVGDHAAVVGHPDAFLSHVHQLLEALLALLQRAGSFLEPGLSSLERGGMTQRRAHEPTQQAERLGVPVGEGRGLRARPP